MLTSLMVFWSLQGKNADTATNPTKSFCSWLAIKRTSPAVITISKCLLRVMIMGLKAAVHIRVDDSCKYFL